jgi:hypothetical protein
MQQRYAIALTLSPGEKAVLKSVFDLALKIRLTSLHLVLL